MSGDIRDDQREHAADHGDVAPPVQHPADGAAAFAAEQRRPVGIGVFQIIRDRPGIDDGGFAVDQHRHLFGIVRSDRILLGEAPRDRLRGQSLMRERHPRPPAERTERTRLVSADQLEQFYGHCIILADERAPSVVSSLPDLIRQSIFSGRWIRGSSPRMTRWNIRAVYFTTAAVCPNNSLRSSSVRIAGWPKFGLTSLAIA